MSQTDQKSAAEGELARLIAEQDRDDRRRRLPGDRRVVRECDWPGRRPLDLDRIEPARGHAPAKWRGRARRVAVRDDLGRWHDTEAAGRRLAFPVLILGRQPGWERVVHDAVIAGDCECPACGDLPLSEWRYCCYCDRSGLDELVAAGKVELYGLKPDTVLNPIAEAYDRERREQSRKAQERRLQRRGEVKGGLGR